MWALVNCTVNTWQSDKSWFMALKQQGWRLLSLELSYLCSTGGLEDTWKTFPWSGIKIKNGFPHLSPFLPTFSRYENVFIISHQCLISQQTRPFESTFSSSSHGQEFILYQLYLRISMKKITHVYSLDIFGPHFSSIFGRKPTAHTQPNFLWVNHSSDGESYLNFYHRQRHCFQRWVWSNYFSIFQVSVSRFAWCNKA